MNFKEFAQKASQAGTKFASQMKEQQQRLSQRFNEGGTMRPVDRFGTTESNGDEETVRLLQLQNDTLRERLRELLKRNEELERAQHSSLSGSVLAGESSPAVPADVQRTQEDLEQEKQQMTVEIKRLKQSLEKAVEKEEIMEMRLKEAERKTSEMEDNKLAMSTLLQKEKEMRQSMENEKEMLIAELERLRLSQNDYDLREHKLNARIEEQRIALDEARAEVDSLRLDSQSDGVGKGFDETSRGESTLLTRIKELEASIIASEQREKDLEVELRESKQIAEIETANLQKELLDWEHKMEQLKTEMNERLSLEKEQFEAIVAKLKDEHCQNVKNLIENQVSQPLPVVLELNIESDGTLKKKIEALIEENVGLKMKISELEENQKDQGAPEDGNQSEHEMVLSQRISFLEQELVKSSEGRTQEILSNAMLKEEIRDLTQKLEIAEEKFSCANEEKGWLQQGAHELNRQLDAIQNDMLACQHRISELEEDLRLAHSTIRPISTTDQNHTCRDSVTEEVSSIEMTENPSHVSDPVSEKVNLPDGNYNFAADGDIKATSFLPPLPPNSSEVESRPIEISPKAVRSTSLMDLKPESLSTNCSFVPHHQRDASYSSEIEPAMDDSLAKRLNDFQTNKEIGGASKCGMETNFMDNPVYDPSGAEKNAATPSNYFPELSEKASPIGETDIESMPSQTPPPKYEDVINSGLVKSAYNEFEIESKQDLSSGDVSSETMEALRANVAALRAEIEDNQKTHELRDKATSVLKEEIEMLRRMQIRSSVDVDYLKEVLVNAFASGELKGSQMIPILARLLEWSPDDMERARNGSKKLLPGISTLESGSSNTEKDSGLLGISLSSLPSAAQTLNLASLFGSSRPES